MLENGQQIGVVTHELFRDARVRLAQVKRVYIVVTSHAEIFAHDVLLVASDIVENENGILFRVLGRYDTLAIAVGKVADAFDALQHSCQTLIFRLMQRATVDVHVFETQPVRILQQADHQVGFTGVGRAANNATDSGGKKGTVTSENALPRRLVVDRRHGQASLLRDQPHRRYKWHCGPRPRAIAL